MSGTQDKENYLIDTHARVRVQKRARHVQGSPLYCRTVGSSTRNSDHLVKHHQGRTKLCTAEQAEDSSYSWPLNVHFSFTC
jgi:hypothetical protein